MSARHHVIEAFAGKKGKEKRGRKATQGESGTHLQASKLKVRRQPGGRCRRGGLGLSGYKTGRRHKSPPTNKTEREREKAVGELPVIELRKKNKTVECRWCGSIY